MDIAEELKFLEENIANINTAIRQATLSGGVSSYTLNSGQGSTTVKRATLVELWDMKRNLEYEYNEKKEYYTGSNISIVRNINNATRFY